jgi:hypothetical protein
MRSTKLLVLFSALALAGCKKEGVDGPLDGCLPVSFASRCATDAQCCSFGCAYGACMPNPLEDGICSTHGDCQAPRLCINQRCTSSVTCIPAPGACTGAAPCCSGTCLAGVCQPDQLPVAVVGMSGASPVPFRVPVQLTNGSYDPDVAGTGLGLSYAWTIVSAPNGSTATFFPAGSYATPTFTPDVIGTYVIGLTASNAGGNGAANLTFQAVNTPPVVSMPPDIVTSVYQSRNVSLTFSAGISDADGGPVTCKWDKTSPASVTTPVVAETQCAGASGAAAVGTFGVTFSEDQAGLWRLTLTAADGVNTVARDRFIEVANDDPVLLPTTGPMATRYGNVGNDAVPLTGFATDVNGDVGTAGFTWSWTVTSTKPAGSAWVDAQVIGTTQTVQFDPDAVGTFRINLHVDDGHGGSADKTVDVFADAHVMPLGTIADASYIAGDRMVLVGTDPAGGAYRLWVVNPSTQSFDPAGAVTLTSAPTALAVSPDASQAIVGEAGGKWEIVNLTARTLVGAQRTGLTFDPTDIVYTDPAWNYALATGATGTIRELLLSAVTAPFDQAASQPVSDPVARGTRAASGTISTTTYVWLLDTTTGALSRYEAKSNGQLMNPSVLSAALAGTGGLWLSADLASLFTTTTGVYAAGTTPTPITLLGAALPAAPGLQGHVYTTDVTGTQQGVIAQPASGSLTRFSGASFSEVAPAAALPLLGVNGAGVPQRGRFAFIRSDGTEYYGVVTADPGTGTRWGLVKVAP